MPGGKRPRSGDAIILRNQNEVCAAQNGKLDVFVPRQIAAVRCGSIVILRMVREGKRQRSWFEDDESVLCFDGQWCACDWKGGC